MSSTRQPAFALVLIGDEYLLASLKLRNQRALYSRLACQISLDPWTPAQCAQYLNAGLGAVGLSPAALEPAATELLASASAGLPRSLCLLARAAWITAATAQAQKIIKTGKSDLLDKFISKAGKPFPAYLVMDKKGKVTFDFPERD